MTPLVCPRCDLPMNRHADKVVAPTNAAEAALVDPVLGGVVQEVHECPGCGASAARTVTRSGSLR